MSVIETKMPTIELPKAPEVPQASPLEAHMGSTAVMPLVEAGNPDATVSRALVNRFIANQEARAAAEVPQAVQTKPFSEVRGPRLQQLNRR